MKRVFKVKGWNERLTMATTQICNNFFFSSSRVINRKRHDALLVKFEHVHGNERICLILHSLFAWVSLMWWKIRLLWVDRLRVLVVAGVCWLLSIDVVWWLSLIVVRVGWLLLVVLLLLLLTTILVLLRLIAGLLGLEGQNACSFGFNLSGDCLLFLNFTVIGK